MEHYGIGQPVRRKEDQRYLTDTGWYLDDIRLRDKKSLFDICTRSA